jgi:ribonuclease G
MPNTTGVQIAINVNPHEVRVAILENEVLSELYIDRGKRRTSVGDVYKGRVAKVLPGMQAAFVDVGQERAAFLYVAEIGGEPELFDETDEPSGERAEAADESDRPASEGRPFSRRGPRKSIEELVEEGQEIMVQITKDAMGTKGPRVTSYVSLPGRYLVYMPTVNHVGVSRRIANPAERNRLRDIVHRLRKPSAGGYIIRTASEGVSEEELRSDIEFLDLIWRTLMSKKEQLPAPALLHTELDLVSRTIRDLFTQKVVRLVVDSKFEYERIQEFVKMYLPAMSPRVELWEGQEPLFDAMGLDIEISKALGRKVWLKSGGYIVIDHTEALTVVDVNTGKFVGRRDLGDTIFKTNIEAAREIAYQLRLRNIGGIIIIDFIDMDRERDRERVYQTFTEALSKDRAETHVLRISELGVIEMSRERTRDDLLRTLCDPCSYCEGRGYTKSPTTVCYEIFRTIRRMGATKERKLIISVHPDVANLLYDQEREGLEQFERDLNKKLIVKADPTLHIEQYDIATL